MASEDPTKNEGKEVSHGDIRCDVCGTVILKEVEKERKEEISKAINSHYNQTQHRDYSFYGRTKLEAK